MIHGRDLVVVISTMNFLLGVLLTLGIPKREVSKHTPTYTVELPRVHVEKKMN